MKSKTELKIGRPKVKRNELKIKILKALPNKTLRFNEIRGIFNINAKILSASLKELVEEKKIVKNRFKEIPPKVEYSLIVKEKSNKTLKRNTKITKNGKNTFL